MIILFFEFIKNLSAIIIVVPPAIFVFSVTFLGAAIEKLHDEEKKEIEKDDLSTKEEIAKIEEKIHSLKNGGAEELTENLKVLERHKNETDKKIKIIKNKYSAINLSNALAYPFFCFMGVMFQAHLGIKLLNNPYDYIPIVISIFVILILLYIGFIKTYKALSLIQEISVNKKEKEYFDRLKDTIKIAISEDRENSKAEVKFNFDQSFPLNINTSTELEISFNVGLIRGSILKNASIWFFIPDGFELIKPSEKEGWRQGGDYNPPNIRTVRIKIGNISVGANIPAILKIKTPMEKKKFKIKYKIYADGYAGTEQLIELINI